MATDEGRISALESWQRSHEEAEREWKVQHQERTRDAIENVVATLSVRIENVESVANEAVAIGRAMKVEMAVIPGKIVEAIVKNDDKKGLNVNSWIALVCVVVSTGVAVMVALK